MLRLKSLSIQNFGPYFGEQKIEFPQDKGVTFIWGTNGLGKTSLLKSIRYALWGEVELTKHESTSFDNVESPIVEYINEKAIDDKLNMSVRLECEVNGLTYIIVRRAIRQPNTEGFSDADYEFSLSVKEGTQNLSQEEAQHFLEKVLPFNISRFYLFDAELLEQYESLVNKKSNNFGLKQAIESILGLPILENSKLAVAETSKSLDKEYTDASKLDSRSQRYSSVLVGLYTKREELTKELADLEKDLLFHQTESSKFVTILSQHSSFSDAINKTNRIKAEITSIKSLLEDRQLTLSDNLGRLWSVMFDISIDNILTDLDSKSQAVKNELDNRRSQNYIKEILSLIVADPAKGCPACGQSISLNTLAEIRKNLSLLSSENHDDKLNEFLRLRTERENLSDLKQGISSSQIVGDLTKYIECLDNLQAKKLELLAAEQERDSFHRNITENDIKEAAENHATEMATIKEIEKAISETEADIILNRTSIEDTKKKISENSSEILKKIVEKQDCINSLYQIFTRGIDAFREELKAKVEESASTLFRIISHNKDYDGLKINDNYGLDIMIPGRTRRLPNRSKGYVQVVALCLLAALHRNAPLSGPIIMDSTFQRIDEQHKQAVLKNLPMLGEQVIVLAFPNEVSKNEARNLLGSSYLKDFNIEYIDPLESRIK